MKRLLLALVFICLGTALQGQEYFPKSDGVKSNNNNFTAFTNAKVYVTPTQIIDNATLLIQNGKVVQVGKTVSLPKNSVIIDASGKYIYPSFIDIYSDFGVEKPKKLPVSGRSAEYNPEREGFYWNDHIMPENKAISKFDFNKEKAKELREVGFGVVNSHIQDGIARGTSVLVALNEQGDNSQRILDDAASQHFSFEKSIAKKQAYPTSLMGSMALLRQMYYDADWYAKGKVDTKDLSLEALNKNKNLVQIFDAGGNGNVLRADVIGDKFNIQYAILGAGDEYADILSIKTTNAPLIIPVNFPEPYDVSNPFHAAYVSLEDMRHWNQAPANPKVLSENGVTFSLTLHQLKSTSKFTENIRNAIKHGLSPTKALEALTTVPARILKKSSEIGSLQVGSQANFLITSGEIFGEGTTLYENWVQGNRNVITDMQLKDIRGDYDLLVEGIPYKLSIGGKHHTPTTELKKGEEILESKITYKENWVDLSFSTDNSEKLYRLTGLILPDSKDIAGRIVLPSGTSGSFKAIQIASFTEKVKTEKEISTPVVVPITYPNVSFGNEAKPKSENLLIKNATVWTSETAGVLQNTDVLVTNGKITKIGKDIAAGTAKVIDATGKHLTAGIIDEHSHIAALAINESGHNSSAEVKMEDVVDPKDINIYRNLAGGVTSLQLLHGSANPIGGRSAILKLKWGESANNLIYNNSPKFIKFALGENVKQSNWGSYNRFPQSRMGVEQVFINYFQMAKEYEGKKKGGTPYRYDEELETLVEILTGERFISCHSYVQSEINMFMKVAEQFGFTINTFTHILEGYKVADKMAKHGVGGSTFSDWWAYKFEVNDAIPYNAAIMHSQGVTVAINSDDREMSRRLNQEAAKTVKYGGVSEEEAWKMVTINPAKLLHLDTRVGSIKEGKDADLVLWTDHPLSIYAKAEKTIIEGATYFDLERDKQQREALKVERNKLITLMLNEKKAGAKTQDPKQSKKEEFHCDSL